MILSKKPINNYMIGIDEAGMGPVFGPLVIGGVLINQNSIDSLVEAGVKDSKKFGSGEKADLKRQETWENVKHHVISAKYVVIDAAKLDNENMYALHISATRKILKALKWDCTHTVIIEQLGQLSREKFIDTLGFCHDGFIYESKADINYPAVSLASIKAKIERDRKVRQICNSIGEEYISGYANKNTEEFFRRYYCKNGKLPPGTRLSRKWAPILEMRGK